MYDVFLMLLLDLMGPYAGYVMIVHIRLIKFEIAVSLIA